MPSYRTLGRLLSLFGILAGIGHLLVPTRLLATARWGYDRILAVEFAPRPNAKRRVRLVGLLMIVGGALGYRALDD
jgi:hypothetical protein